MKVLVAQPDRPIWEGEAKRVFVPLKGGDVWILNHHAPMIGILREGEVIIDSDSQERIKVMRGLLRVKDNEVDILVR